MNLRLDCSYAWTSFLHQKGCDCEKKDQLVVGLEFKSGIGILGILYPPPFLFYRGIDFQIFQATSHPRLPIRVNKACKKKSAHLKMQLSSCKTTCFFLLHSPVEITGSYISCFCWQFGSREATPNKRNKTREIFLRHGRPSLASGCQWCDPLQFCAWHYGRSHEAQHTTEGVWCVFGIHGWWLWGIFNEVLWDDSFCFPLGVVFS